MAFLGISIGAVILAVVILSMSVGVTSEYGEKCREISNDIGKKITYACIKYLENDPTLTPEQIVEMHRQAHIDEYDKSVSVNDLSRDSTRGGNITDKARQSCIALDLKYKNVDMPLDACITYLEENPDATRKQVYDYFDWEYPKEQREKKNAEIMEEKRKEYDSNEKYLSKKMIR